MAGRSLTPREMLQYLVGFDTTSAKSNLALVDFVADYLDGHGVAVRLIHDEARTKANLFATVGPEAAGGVALSGHTDVVPVAGQSWTGDPFALDERGGLLYGRGAADMKGFIACALALVPEFLARRLVTPIHFALSYDEEVGCLGVRRMIPEIVANLPRPRLVIVGEPTGMRVVGAHKGIAVLTTIVTGKDGHSSRPREGVNAIAWAAEIVGFLSALADDLAAEAQPGDPFDPPGTTLNVGTIAGGTAVNIIARECRIHWEFRPVPGADPAAIQARLDDFVASEVLPRMRRTDPAANVTTRLDVASPPLAGDPASPAVRLARRLTGANETGTAAFMCEAGLYHAAGMPAVVCGPGSIAQAHQPDEFLAIDQLDACAEFLRRLAAWAASGEAP
jgi:acetylornithine deacetylase